MARPQLIWQQFGLRGLLLYVTLFAVALGTGRWLWYSVKERPRYEVLVQLPESRGEMEPTLNGREILAPQVNAYWKTKPIRFEIVAFNRTGMNNGRVLRVIGLPGETISFEGGKVLINDRFLVMPPQLQDIKYHRDISDESVPHPYTVPSGSYYLLGDNPDKANDSRMWGALPEERIFGRVYGGRQANR